MMQRILYGSWLFNLVIFGSGCDRTAPQTLASASPVSQASDEQSSFQLSTPVEGQNEVPRLQSAEPTGLPVLQSNGLDVEGRILAPALNDQTEIINRPFAKLQPLQSESPAALIQHLREIDLALQDLVLAGSSNFLDETSFTEGGMRLGRMKRSAGQQLASSPKASPEERKAGLIAQLVALSHMSGLRDVEAARELERFAAQLVSSDDADLAHQSRVVLLGFELQALQNGLQQAPDQLLAQVDQLFTRPVDRNFPEFMVLQQAYQVLLQMGFVDAANTVRDKLIQEYRQSSDPQLRGEAWLIETQVSQAYQNFMLAFRNLGTPQFDSQAALVAVRGLYEAFPTPQTIEQIVSALPNIEYSGYVELSQDVVSFTRQILEDHLGADLPTVKKGLADHEARVALVGKPVQLSGLIGFDGQPLDWKAYDGNVVLVDFWASWCIKCLREFRSVRDVHAEFSSQGFEVLSINMDENLSQAQEFVKQQGFPWRSFHNEDTQALGFRSPLAGQLGISAIPFMLVVDREGIVRNLHVRGEMLRPTVQRLLYSGN